MPYNIDKDQGGDTKENTNWMERCVSAVQKKGHTKSEAIAICKAQMKKSDSSEIVEDEVLASFSNTKRNFYHLFKNKGYTEEQVKILFDIDLDKHGIR